MSAGVSPLDMSAAFIDEIRAIEETQRAAFLAADLGTLRATWAEGYHVNSPLERGVGRTLLLDLLGSGRLRHLAFESHVETIERFGDTVVVMGHDMVIDPPGDQRTLRRFTNVWQRHGDRWLGIARHAHVLVREPVVATTV